MSKPDHEVAVQRELIDACRVVRAYAESDGSKAVVAMLDAMGKSYTMDLVNCSVDQLIQIQSCIKLTYALRGVLTAESQNIPKI